MAQPKDVLRAWRASDGRIRTATALGVLALTAILAIFGILPAIAASVTPVVIQYGGGSGACNATIDGRLPSAARNEFHINNPMLGNTYTKDGIKVTIKSTTKGLAFDFVVEGANNPYVVYDVIVNGGRQNNHYDYDGDGSGPVKGDTDLHAPNQTPNKYFNLSHINICYDVPGAVLFACDDPEILEGEGLITNVTATIFDNSTVDCVPKRATYTLGQDIVTLEFDGDGTGIVAGRIDFTKDFGDPTSFKDLQYRRTTTDSFVNVAWCAVRDRVGGVDGNEFDDVLAADEYPSLVNVTDGGGAATSCKVFEGENAAGIQHTVVYFELEDPQWR
jgi:hypothetical protein